MRYKPRNGKWWNYQRPKDSFYNAQGCKRKYEHDERSGRYRRDLDGLSRNKIFNIFY